MMVFTLSKETNLSAELLSKILQKHKAEQTRYTNLENYYLAKHSILARQMQDINKPNNKVVNPYPQYITDTLCGYFCGEPIAYMATDENALEELNLVLTYNDSAAEDMNLARDASIYGVAYEIMYIDEDNITRFTKINPKDMVLIYDDTLEADILYAIRIIPIYNILNDKTTYQIEVYSRDSIKRYNANESFSSITYIDEEPHYFGLVPVIEYKNNEQKIGDYESIIPLIDAYDKLESDSLNDFEYFVDAYMVLTGMTADAEDIKQMKENRVLLLDNDATAQWLIKGGNDAVIENMKNRIEADIHKFSKVPNLSDENFAANASGVAIKFKLYGTETLIASKERCFKKGLQRRIELIFNISNLKGAAHDWRSVSISFIRNLPTNDSEIADTVQKLAGIVSNETLLAQIPFVDDVMGEMERLEKFKETNPFYNLDVEMEADNNAD